MRGKYRLIDRQEKGKTKLIMKNETSLARQEEMADL
jgi:hypothetical protein